MKNSTFIQQSERERQRKLHVVLRKLIGTRVSEEQRSKIEQAVRHKRQFRLQLCGSRQSAHHLLSGEGKSEGRFKVQTLIGSIADPPMVVLCQERSKSKPRPCNTVFIYIPNDDKGGTPR